MTAGLKLQCPDLFRSVLIWECPPKRCCRSETLPGLVPLECARSGASRLNLWLCFQRLFMPRHSQHKHSFCFRDIHEIRFAVFFYNDSAVPWHLLALLLLSIPSIEMFNPLENYIPRFLRRFWMQSTQWEEKLWFSARMWVSFSWEQVGRTCRTLWYYRKYRKVWSTNGPRHVTEICWVITAWSVLVFLVLSIDKQLHVQGLVPSSLRSSCRKIIVSLSMNS